jgi:dTDP-4-amino-4,6-dideoxygalactose transaminase
VDKYTWVDIGSSYLPGEIIGAFLWAQMEEAEAITERRLQMWETYHQSLAPVEKMGKIRRPIVPAECRHNAHMYYILLPDLRRRTEFIARLKENDIGAVFHYVPLHDSPMGIKYCRIAGELPVTREMSDRLVRLPLWLGLEEHLADTIHQITDTIGRL